MKVINQIMLIILLAAMIFISVCRANELVSDPLLSAGENKKNSLLHIPPTNILPINPELLFLIAQLKQTSLKDHKVEIAVAQLTLSKTPLNAAEQYLLLVAQVLLKEQTKEKSTDNISDHSSHVIALLQQAKKLSEQISEQQLAQPEFLQLHLLLAKHYAKQEAYD